MIPKIKMLVKKMITGLKGAWQAANLPQRGKKMLSWLKKLWSSSENRVLLILIAAVLVLLIAAITLLFGINWKNTVGICYSTDTNPSNAATRQMLENALAARGYEVIVTDAGDNQARQLEQIQDMADRRCKAIVVEPVMMTAGEELAQAIKRAKLPTVLLNRRPDGLEQIPCIGGDECPPGTVLGQMVAALPNGGDINGDGVVSYLLLQGSEQDDMGELLSEGLAENIESIQLVSVSYGAWTEDGGREACSQEYATYGKDIEVVLCTNDAMAIGASAAIADGGWIVGQDVYLYGIGAEQKALQMIRDGEMTGTVYTDENGQANAVIDALLSQIAGQTPQTQYAPICTPVTADNVRQFLP